MNQPITFLVWTDNSPGVLLRLTTLFTRRKINVDSLTVSATEEEGISRFTIVVTIDPVIAATVGRQIERMIEVRRVFVFAERDVVHREVALIRVRLTDGDERDLGARHADARILERGERGSLIQFSGTESEISELLLELRPYGITEFVRSGRIAVTIKGDHEHDLTRSLHELRPGASEGPDI